MPRRWVRFDSPAALWPPWARGSTVQGSPAVRRVVLAAVAALSAAALQTSDALAARVSLSAGDTADLRFEAGKGERNRLSITVGPAKAIVRDTGARVRAGKRCRARSLHVV